MIKLLGSNKGLTIVELILSITILAIITVPVMACFVNITAINLHAKHQLEIDAVMGVIRTEVVDAVKNNLDVVTESGTSKINTGSHLTDVKINGGTGFDNYRYDVVGVEELTEGSYIKNVVECNINVKKKKGSTYNTVQGFRVIIYKEP